MEPVQPEGTSGMANPNHGRGARTRSRAIGLCLVLTASLALAQVDSGVLDRAQELLKAGKAEEAYSLLEPLEIAGAGDPMYDHLLGTAALESNRPSKASFVYERILAVTPDHIGVRTDMGRAYLALGDYGRAKIEFESVLALQNLPPDLRSTVERYASAAEATSQNRRTTGSVFAEWGVGSDTNIGSATALATVTVPAIGLYAPAPPSGKETADNYRTVGLGGEITHQLTDRWSLYGGADYRGRRYQLYSDSDYATLDARFGVNYSGGAWLLRTGLSTGQYNLDHSRLRSTTGVSLDWRLALDGRHQVSLGANIADAHYQLSNYASQDTQTTALSAGWLTAFGDGSTVLSLTGSLGMEKAVAGRDDGDRHFSGPRLTLQTNLADTMGAYAAAGATRSRYASTNSLYLVSREETQYDLSLGMTWAVGKGLSVRPQFSAVRNRSNADLYTYDKNDWSVNMRFDY